MTVCIALIATDIYSRQPMIVFASDRLVSTDAICFEGGNSKIELLNLHAYIMASSTDAVNSDEIIIKTRLRIPDEECSVKQIAEILAEECKLKFESGLKEKRKQVFSRYDLTSKEFKSKSRTMSDRVVMDIIRSLDKIEYEFKTKYFEAEFLVVGIDYAPHIFVVDQFGDIRTFDHQGFAAIGSGQLLAFPEIVRLTYSLQMSDGQAIVTVYNAKKRAEKALGVGEETDLILLTKDKNNTYTVEIAKKALTDKLDKNLEKIYDSEMESNDRVSRDIQNSVRSEMYFSYDGKFDDEEPNEY